MSLSFLLLFTAFSAIQNLAGHYLIAPLGFIQGTVLYVTFAVSCLFGPLIGSKLGAKWSLFCGFIGYMCYAAAAMVTTSVFVQSHNSTLVPKEFCINGTNITGFKDNCYDTTVGWVVELIGAALCGFCASFLWYAQGVYITKSAIKYNDAVVRSSQGQKTPKDSKGLFNGIFFGFFQLTQVTGNLVGSVLLKNGWPFHTICLVYLISAAAGTILCFFLRSVNSAAERKEEQEGVSVVERLKGPLSLLFKDFRLPLLVFFMIYTGVEQVFMWADYTSNYIAVALNPGDIGYILAVFGVCDAIFSVVVGKLSDIVGQLPMVYLGFAAQAGVLVFLEFSNWDDGDPMIPLYICAGIWGLGDAVANTVMNAIIGNYFSESEMPNAFANLKLWQSLACAVGFSYSRATEKEAIQMRRYGIFGMLVVALISYTILAAWQKRKKQALPDGE
jgi:MFS family permease